MADSSAVLATRNFLIKYKDYDAANVLPADTVDYGAAWTGFTDLGYSSGGLSFNAAATYGSITADQEFFAVARPLQSIDLNLGANLIEFNPANIQRAMSGMGTLSTVAAGSGTRGNDELEINSTLNPTANSWGFDIQGGDGEAIRFFTRYARATSSISSTIAPDSATGVALQVTPLPDPTDQQILLIHDVSAAL